MMDALAADGFREVDAPDGADLVLLNTCHIREKAVGEGVFRTWAPAIANRGPPPWRRWPGHDAWPSPVAWPRRKALKSCAGQPFVDMVFGPQAYHRLPEMVARASAPRRARAS